jgi:hypothetical protein
LDPSPIEIVASLNAVMAVSLAPITPYWPLSLPQR